jgi:carbamoyl-phosphate synthase small subunit
MRAAISTVELDPVMLARRVRETPGMLGAKLFDQVSTDEPYVVPAVGPVKRHVVALDLGIKRSTPEHMSRLGIEVHVLPASSGIHDVLAVNPDGIFFSNGPGDPATADHPVELAREVLRRKLPLFGICFGHQILGRALGFDTVKLRYGHRGINQPVLDRATGKVEVTSHNHGFAVEADVDGDVIETEFGRVEVSHICLNDNVAEGLRCLDRPAFSVQYHPEAAAGPHDAAHLFDRFIALMEANPDA